jgi:hypothetical protein
MGQLWERGQESSWDMRDPRKYWWASLLREVGKWEMQRRVGGRRGVGG